MTTLSGVMVSSYRLEIYAKINYICVPISGHRSTPLPRFTKEVIEMSDSDEERNELSSHSETPDDREIREACSRQKHAEWVDEYPTKEEIDLLH